MPCTRETGSPTLLQEAHRGVARESKNGAVVLGTGSHGARAGIAEHGIRRAGHNQITGSGLRLRAHVPEVLGVTDRRAPNLKPGSWLAFRAACALVPPCARRGADLRRSPGKPDRSAAGTRPVPGLPRQMRRLRPSREGFAYRAESSLRASGARLAPRRVARDNALRDRTSKCRRPADGVIPSSTPVRPCTDPAPRRHSVLSPDALRRLRGLSPRGSRRDEPGLATRFSLGDVDGQRAVTTPVEDIAPDSRKDSLGRLELQAPLEKVRRGAMLCRELREPPGVAVHGSGAGLGR